MASQEPATITPFISIREWIRWNRPSSPLKRNKRASHSSTKPTEPTSTLVLTSPNRVFIDIRILSSPHYTYQQTSAKDYGTFPLPVSAIDWAFAGISWSAPHSEGQAHQAKWHHQIDSRCAPGELPGLDEGFMFPQEDGRTLEKGSMINPSTGRMEDYEEMWRDLDAMVLPREQKRWCIVVRLYCQGWQGLIVRVGQYVQGLMKDMGSGEIGVERWEFDVEAEKEERRMDWRRTVKIGNRFLPCIVAWHEVEKLEVGHVVQQADFVWTVEEVYGW